MNKLTTGDLVVLMDFYHATLNVEDLNIYSTVRVAGVTKESMQEFVQLENTTFGNGLKSGYLFSSKVANEIAKAFLNSKSISTENTFYKTWQEVMDKSLAERLTDQFIHYMYAYERNITWTPEPIYTPGTKEEINVDYNSYTKISVISLREMINNIIKTLNSGIALRSDIVKLFVKVISLMPINADIIENLKNREAKTIYYSINGCCPRKGEDIVKHLVYITIHESMVINNHDTYHEIAVADKSNAKKIFDSLNDEQWKELARVFRRYKNILLAFKKNGYNYRASECAPYINKLRKLSNKYHKPMKTNFFDNMLTCDYDHFFFAYGKEGENHREAVQKKMAGIDNFRIIRLLNNLAEKSLIVDKKSYADLFTIRNGKTFIKENCVGRYFKGTGLIKKYISHAYSTMFYELMRRLHEKHGSGVYYKLPKDMKITAPTSEKNFLGDYPAGSSFDISQKDAIVGIYWRGEWKVQDYDLSVNSFSGVKYGWNGAWKGDSNEILFSGDMVKATPDACEMFYCSNECPEGVIKVNTFNGENNGKFRFFVSHENIHDALKNHIDSGLNGRKSPYQMLNEKNIKFTCEIPTPLRETQVGIVLNHKLYLCNNITGDGRVSSICDYEKELRSIYKRRLDTMLSIDKIMKCMCDTPLWDWHEITKDTVVPEGAKVIDLTTFSKADIIELFSSKN